MKEFLKDLTIRKFYQLKLWNEEKSSYLHKSGWIKSFKQKAPVDVDGEPIPWLSLPCVYFLKSCLSDKGGSISVFEYGSGNSTFFWAKHCKEVVSVEHDQPWFEKVSEQTAGYPNSKQLFFALEDGESYEKAILQEDHLFDIILIDGRKRVECLRNAMKKLSSAGVLIFDDSQRERYEEGLTLLRKQGYREIPFWGMAAGSIHEKCTSVFYREENCLRL